MAKGGARVGAGRPVGVKNKKGLLPARHTVSARISDDLFNWVEFTPYTRERLIILALEHLRRCPIRLP